MMCLYGANKTTNRNHRIITAWIPRQTIYVRKLRVKEHGSILPSSIDVRPIDTNNMSR